MRIFRFVSLFTLAWLLLASAVPAALAQTADSEPWNVPQGVPSPMVIPEGTQPRPLNLLPSVFVDTVTISSNQGNTLEGVFSVRNGGSEAVSGLKYELIVLGELPEAEPNTLVFDDAPLYDVSRQSEIIALAAGETKEVFFSYQYPPLPTGKYRLQVQMVTTEGRPLGWNHATFDVMEGINDFLVIEGGLVKVTSADPITGDERSEWGPAEGVNVDPGQPVTFEVDLRNVGSNEIVATPHISVHKVLTASEEVLEEVDLELLTVGGQAATTYIFDRAAATEPGVYQVRLEFMQNGHQISGFAEFQYVVRGSSASLVSPQIEELPGKAGEVAKVSLGVAGPADRESAPEQLAVRVEFLKEGRVVGATDDAVTLNDPLVPIKGTFSVPLQEDICGADVTMVVSLKMADGRELDRHETSVAEFVPECPPAGALSTSKNLTAPLMIGGGLLLAVALGIGYFLLRTLRRPAGPIPPLTILIFGLAVAGGAALYLSESKIARANGVQWVVLDTNVRFGAEHALAPLNYLYINSPIHGGTYKDTVLYSGYIRSYNCANVTHEGAIYLWLKNGDGHVTTPSGHNWTYIFGQPLPPIVSRNKTWRTATFNANVTVPEHVGPKQITFWTQFESIYHHVKNGRSDLVMWDFTWINYQRPLQPVGRHGETSCVAIEGWACDPNNPAATTTVYIMDGAIGRDGGRFVGTALANLPGNQPSVAAACSGHTNKRFRFEVPDSLKDGQPHEIYIQAMDDMMFGWAGGINPLLNNSPQTITCEPPPPPESPLPIADPTPPATSKPECSDTVDNDGDNKVDVADPGCHTDGNANNPSSYDPNDDDERDIPQNGSPECSDNVDNDGDNEIDETDPGCHTDGNANNPSSYNPNDDDERDTTGSPSPGFSPGTIREVD